MSFNSICGIIKATTNRTIHSVELTNKIESKYSERALSEIRSASDSSLFWEWSAESSSRLFLFGNKMQKTENKRFVDLAGQVIGRLTVLRFAGRKRSRAFWLCECSCGQQITVRADALQSKRTKSCGCLHKEILKNSNMKHNSSYSPEYRSYLAAKGRCNNPNATGYEHYGGRGIKFLFSNFAEFLAAVGERPEPKHIYSIDRIDNSGHYQQGNVRWATRTQQLKNRRNSISITYNGRTNTIPELSKIYGINEKTLRRRICVYKWCLNCALTKPTVKGLQVRCEHNKENT